MHTPPPKQELLELERRYWKAIQTGDVETATRLTDFPCLINGSRGFGAIDQTTFTRMMGDRSYSIDRVELSDDAEVRFLGDDVALVAYEVHEEVTVNGQPLALEASESSTWVRRDGHWACAQHSEALSGDPFGRDKLAAQAPQSEAQGRTAEADERAIRALVADFLRAAEAHDVAAMLGMMSDDAVFQIPGAAPFGKDAFATFAGGARASRIKVESSRLEELAVLGDWAFGRTHLALEITPPEGGPQRRIGHTLSIFKRGPQGKWLLARDSNTQVETD